MGKRGKDPSKRVLESTGVGVVLGDFRAGPGKQGLAVRQWGQFYDSVA